MNRSQRCDDNEKSTSVKSLPITRTRSGGLAHRPAQENGRSNVMTMSWHMMVEFEPPLIACVVSNANYSFSALRATKECVIAVPSVQLAPKIVEIGNCSGRDVDKFEKFALTQISAKCVAPPLVAECFANLECKVYDTRFVNKYNLFVLEVIKARLLPNKRAQRPSIIKDSVNLLSMAR